MSNKPSSCITTGAGCSSSTNYPQFIDTGYCLCGLVNSRVPSRNGNSEQLWRCIGDANEDVNGTKSDHGEWYYPQYPSSDLSGINQPQNWASNPPDSKTAYALAPANSNTKKYVTQSTFSTGQDPGCTAVNNTKSSAQYYSNSKSSANSNMAASSSIQETTIMINTISSTVSTATSSQASSTSTESSPPSSTVSASPSTATATAGNQGASIVPSISLKSLCVLGMLAIPAIVGLA